MPPPLWFERGLVTATAAVVSFGSSGLLLALAGHYRMSLVAVLGAGGGALLSLFAWPRRNPDRPGDRRATLPAVGLCVLAVGVTAWNSVDAGHHVAIGRDPGVYAVTGRWIATHGDLQVRTGAPWSIAGAVVGIETPGVYPVGTNRLEFQFNHLMPVLLAEADNLGGDRLMFRVPAVLGGLALGAIYAVGCRLVPRPWLVLAAVGALALCLPQLNVSRDTYSEPSVEFLLWAGIWLVLGAIEGRRPPAALLAGAALGGTMLSRVDALAYLIPLPALGVVAWLFTRSDPDRRRIARTLTALTLGIVPMAVLGTVDVVNSAGRYYSDLRSEVHALQAGLALSVLAAVLALVGQRFVAPRGRALVRRAAGNRNAIGAVAGCAVAFGLLAMWALRPAMTRPHASPVALIGGLQRAAGLPYDPARSYAENTVGWLGWYLGPVTLALGILGAAILVARTSRRPDPAAVLVLSVTGFATVIYLWNPHIVPDQIWAMRRFVPAALPLLVLLAAAAIDAVADAVAGSLRRAGFGSTEVVLAAGAAGLVAFPLGVTIPVCSFQPQAGYAAALANVCHATGSSSAILFASDDQLGLMLSPAVRSWCDVPVAVLTGAVSRQRLRELATAWRTEGRSLWVLGSTPEVVARSAPGVAVTRIANATSTHELEPVINRPPQAYSVDNLTVYAGQVSR